MLSIGALMLAPQAYTIAGCVIQVQGDKSEIKTSEADLDNAATKESVLKADQNLIAEQ